MRIGGILFALALTAAGTLGALAQGKGVPLPDATRQYYQRQNCHQVYDMLVAQDRGGSRLNDADAAWAKVYEENSGTGKPCPAPPEALAKRASNRTVATAQGIDKIAGYAEKDDPAALYEIALVAIQGGTKEVTPQQGLNILRKAAEMGDPSANYQLSQQYFVGNMGKPQDYAGGLPWLLKAAEANHVDAIFQAGALYANGLGVKKDMAKAFGFFRRAAEQGHVFGTYLAAQMANEGAGVKKDHALAYRLGRNLAEAGETSGAIFAASALLQMKDVKKHQDEILYWMDRAHREGADDIKAHINKLRPQVVAVFNKMNAPPEYRPRERKACPMKTVCYVNQFTRVQQCTTNKDYWSDCDG
ncbi:tetratricopeptide repeat protein [Sphingomonas soli]|uniref:tetratricopeptide repeat protein n=1 Tax=Sphingomonas soli TaxID=266127 RepID=UPI00083157D5|nr:tetratricopeptide repeat protein [Sphingomonas soli]